MKYVISGPRVPFRGKVSIPTSKSISNRLLIMQALSGQEGEPARLSGSDDSRVLRHALQHPSENVDIGHAGTAMRFLAAYLATGNKEVFLTGSARMKQRPIGPLVDALRLLGADISYEEAEGCPPLRIAGGLKKGGRLEVDGGISSQFISALMMIGPVLDGGLQIHLKGDVVSASYINMTLALMRSGGTEASFTGREIRISQGAYHFDAPVVEADWSGASYWYQVAALLPGSEIILPGLEQDSLQGDAVLASLFEKLGVSTQYGPGGVTLHSGGEVDLPQVDFSHDFTLCPDLVQTLASTLCALGIPYNFTGCRTLRVKETDRVSALQNELGKLGFRLESDEEGNFISWDGIRGQAEKTPLLLTYHDHRMALALAPLSACLGPLGIDDPGVVSKSYPSYWEDLRRAGFEIAD